MDANLAITEIRFQNGPQKLFEECESDIAVYGGEAGGGKTWSIVAQPLRHIHNPKFRCGIFRRTMPQITGQGGLWDEACELYPLFGGRMRGGSELDCTFPSGARVSFEHLQHENTKYNHQGKQYCLLEFDEATHFTRSQILYLFSRNRSVCGIKPYIRMSCNPDPASFIAELIAWWIGEDGYAIRERSGVVRYLVIDNQDIHFFDSVDEAITAFPDRSREDILSFTFIHARLEDNPSLQEKDPGYAGRLKSLPKIERDRLEKGNWHSREGSIIDVNSFKRFQTNQSMVELNYHGEFLQIPLSSFRCFATIDTAGTSKEKAAEKRGDPPSYSVCAIWGYHRHRDRITNRDILILRHVWRQRVGWNDLKERIPAFLHDWNVPLAVIENAHYGQPLSCEIKGRQTKLIGPVIPGMDDGSRGAKLERAIASGLLSRLEDIGIWIPAEDDVLWIKVYLRELSAWTGLPKETSDQIDVSSYAAFHCKSMSSSWGGVV